MPAAAIEFTFNLGPLGRRIAAAPGILYRHMRDGIRDVGRTFETEFRARRMLVHGPESVAKRTGQLSRSFAGRAIEGKTLDTLKATFGFGPPAVPAYAGGAHKYAGLQETGGTVRPSGHPYLAIPLDVTEAGVARHRSPRDVPGGFFFTSRRGNLLFGVREGKGVRPLFAMKREVTIPPRLHFQDDWKAFEPRAENRLRKSVIYATREIGKVK